MLNYSVAELRFTKIVQQKTKVYFDSFNIDYIVMCILLIIIILL